MLALQRHGDSFDGPLGGTDRPGSPGDVIGEQQQPAGHTTRVISRTAACASGMAHSEKVQTTVSKDARWSYDAACFTH